MLLLGIVLVLAVGMIVFAAQASHRAKAGPPPPPSTSDERPT